MVPSDLAALDRRLCIAKVYHNVLIIGASFSQVTARIRQLTWLYETGDWLYETGGWLL